VWSTLGAIAAVTERVELGPLVANVTTRPAAHVATAAAPLQSLSGGRLRLGLGAGASEPSPSRSR
jgi:alkanesulfonate monooxygenase SsuD/methylene tetrahydromethanopterin reductase-like flavin-dependent oxidoreductase (luciferase family)